MKIKKCSFLLLLLVFCFTFTSCNYTKDEIKNRLIIQAIGIDALSNGGVRVTLQTLNTEMAGNPNSGSNLGDIINSVSVEGKTVSDAISNVTKKIGKKPLLSQNRLIIFGKETAKQGLYPYLDYFIRSSQNRATVSLAISNGTAEELVSLKIGESILPANSLEDILNAQIFHLEILNQQLFQFVNKLQEPNTDAFLPIIEMDKSEKGEGKFKMNSVGVFSNDALEYELRNDEIAALQLLTNSVSGGSFSVENSKFKTSSTANIIKSKTKVHSEIINGIPKFKIKISMTIHLLENQTEKPYMLEKSFLNSTVECYEEYVKALLEKNLQNVLIIKESDPFAFGRKCSIEHPFFYKRNLNHFKNKIKNAEYKIIADIKISNIGLGTENF